MGGFEEALLQEEPNLPLFSYCLGKPFVKSQTAQQHRLQSLRQVCDRIRAQCPITGHLASVRLYLLMAVVGGHAAQDEIRLDHFTALQVVAHHHLVLVVDGKPVELQERRVPCTLNLVQH